MVNFTEENIKLVKKFIDIRARGYYVQGAQVTKVYNEVLGKNVAVTNCSSCLRSRIQELENALRKWEQQEAKKAAEATEITETQEKKEEEPQDVNNSKPHKAKRRKAK